MSEITWLRYVRHADVPAYEALGWINLGALPLPHGAYSVLMEWCFAGLPQ